MKNYELIAREIYAPLINGYNLQFASLNNWEFFLIGKGFALQISLDPRDGEDTWYVSVNSDGNVLTYKLMYLMVERFTSQDSENYGNPATLDERMTTEMRTDAAFILNKCKDILSGDKSWLHNYKGKGYYNREVARFLAPYFREQGYPVSVSEDS